MSFFRRKQKNAGEFSAGSEHLSLNKLISKTIKNFIFFFVITKDNEDKVNEMSNSKADVRTNAGTDAGADAGVDAGTGRTISKGQSFEKTRQRQPYNQHKENVQSELIFIMYKIDEDILLLREKIEEHNLTIIEIEEQIDADRVLGNKLKFATSKDSDLPTEDRKFIKDVHLKLLNSIEVGHEKIQFNKTEIQNIETEIQTMERKSQELDKIWESYGDLPR